MVLAQQDIHMQKNELESYLTPYTKIKSKWIKCLNTRVKTIKLFKGNIVKIHVTWIRGQLFRCDTKTKAIKEK